MKSLIDTLMAAVCIFCLGCALNEENFTIFCANHKVSRGKHNY